MDFVDKEAIKRFRSLSECCICLMTYTDPRMLPCVHSACLKCFEDIQSKNEKKPGDVLPCPLCRKEFTIPPEGMKGLQKNFFIENLIEVTKAVKLESKFVPCDACGMLEESSDVAKATMRCLNCCENYCLRCSKLHKIQKMAKDHNVVEISSSLKDEEIRHMCPIRKCKKHHTKVLDYYCSDCKTVICVSCFVECHKLHECKEVTAVDKDFRQKIENSSIAMSNCMNQMLRRKEEMEKQKIEFFAKTLETENAIRSNSDQLKALIEQHTQEVLNELSLLKKKHQKKIETEIEEIERNITVLESFIAYCTELKSKGSPSEVCVCADNLLARSKELNRENEEYSTVHRKSVGIEFIATDQNLIFQNVSNVIGRFSESVKQSESCAVVIGKDVIKINLNRPDDVSKLPQLPTAVSTGAAAAVYWNSIFVTGVGKNRVEIWRFDGTTLRWNQCVSLLLGRRFHSVAFVDHVMYMCGGWGICNNGILDDVEAYDTIDEKCTNVGKLTYAVRGSGKCVNFKASLYIFGGLDANSKVISNVQVYDTKLNTCTLLSKPMPKTDCLLNAALWENSAVMFGRDTCFIYNFDTETWQVRAKFKTDVNGFGLIINNDKIFIIDDLKRHDVRCISTVNFLNDETIEWMHHAKLPKPSMTRAYVAINFVHCGILSL